MEKKYKCGMCGSKSEGTPGTCCGGERKVCDTCNVEHSDHKMESAEHNHKEGETCAVCSAK